MNEAATLPPTPHDSLQAVAPVPATGKITATLPQPVPGYRVEHQIGAGAMGEVYQAWQESPARLVALKVMPAAVALDELRRKLFLRELEALGRLNHANIVTVYSGGVVGDALYIAMELVRGSPLSALLSAGHLQLPQALLIVRDIALGLAHAHQFRITHRDIKPANVMVTHDGTAKIIDFGLALLLDPARSQLAPSAGTPMYCAPEQSLGRPDVGPPADVYALGKVLQEIASGGRAEPGRPSLLSGLGRVVGPLISRMLEEDPERRPSISEVSTQIDVLLERPCVKAHSMRGRRGMPALLMCTAIACVLWAFSGPLSRLHWDLVLCAAGKHRLHPDIVLVDTQTSPCSRAKLAHAIRTCFALGAKVVALDVLLDSRQPGAGPHGSEETEALCKALKDTQSVGRVVLVSSLTGHRPLQELESSAGATGFGNFVLDPDHTVRRTYLASPDAANADFALGWVAVQLFQSNSPERLRPSRPPRTVPDPLPIYPSDGEVDQLDVDHVTDLDTLAEPGAILARKIEMKGKLVLFGATQDGRLGDDLFRTPFSLLSKTPKSHDRDPWQPMAVSRANGVWLHASIVGSLLGLGWPCITPWWAGLLLSAVGAGLAILLARICLTWFALTVLVAGLSAIAFLLPIMIFPWTSLVLDALPFVYGMAASLALLYLRPTTTFRAGLANGR